MILMQKPQGTEGVSTVVTVGSTAPVHDPNYDWIPPLPPLMPANLATKLGVQCGECGMKFDYDKAYGYACQNQRCPRRGFSR